MRNSQFLVRLDRFHLVVGPLANDAQWTQMCHSGADLEKQQLMRQKHPKSQMEIFGEW